jgi:hypothetical protein
LCRYTDIEQKFPLDSVCFRTAVSFQHSAIRLKTKAKAFYRRAAKSAEEKHLLPLLLHYKFSAAAAKPAIQHFSLSAIQLVSQNTGAIWTC